MVLRKGTGNQARMDTDKAVEVIPAGGVDRRGHTSRLHSKAKTVGKSFKQSELFTFDTASFAEQDSRKRSTEYK